ncbi:MAG TPA: cytochrome c biogenesis protein ResB [Nitriliruptoraceae bacterium]|nr:cytochrome c biogenesis protein ResB [Nitriliruptoraceae bacterium]
MKTALIILGILGVITLLATVVPQEPNVAATVADWRSGEAGPGVVVSQVIDLFGLYDAYGSPLFLALLLLLFLSLTACLIPRIRAFARLARRGRPPLSRHLDSHPHHIAMQSPRRPDEVRADVTALLTRRRWRLRAATADGLGHDQVAAEKGIIAREGGSLVFHLSFYLLLVGIVAGQLLQFVGQVGVIEGQSVADTPAAYWNVEAGRWFEFDDHRGFNLQLDEFRVDWVRSLEFAGQPSLFEADVTVTEEDGSVRSDTIAGNVPMVVDDFKVHLLDWGYAPVLQVAVDGEVVWEGTQAAQGTDQGFFRTAIKVPAEDPDIGFQVGVYPYAPDNDDGVPNFTGAPWPDAPVAVVAMYEGDLALTSAQNVNILDTSRMELATTAFVRLGETVEVADGVEVSFPELRTWAGFQVSYRPTVPVLLAGALLLLVGLVPALYAYRRRLWVEVVADGDGGTLVTVAGRTFQRADAFGREFDELAGRIAEVADATPVATPRRHDADDTTATQRAATVSATAAPSGVGTRPDQPTDSASS